MQLRKCLVVVASLNGKRPFARPLAVENTCTRFAVMDKYARFCRLRGESGGFHRLSN